MKTLIICFPPLLHSLGFVLFCPVFFFFLIQLPSLVSLAFNLGVCLNSFVFQQLPAGAALIFGLSRSLM